MASRDLIRKGRKSVASTKPPFALEGIDHVLLLVKNMKAAERFYTTVLGCSIAGRLPEYGMMQMRAGSAWAVPPISGGRNLDHLCLALGSHGEGELRRHLARHRVQIVEEGIHGGSRGESLSLYVRGRQRDRAQGSSGQLNPALRFLPAQCDLPA